MKETKAKWTRLPRTKKIEGNGKGKLVLSKRSGGEEVYDELPIKRRVVSPQDKDNSLLLAAAVSQPY